VGLGLLAAVAALLVAAPGASSPGRAPSPVAAFGAYRTSDASIGTHEQRRLEAAAWQGGTFTASTGESVRVLVSDAYPDGMAVGQRWADFFASLLHGSELRLVTAHVVTPAEMSDFCGPHALGCYGGGDIVFMGETVAGVTAEEVARHEYGHHVAANRPNPPWLAVDTGPKNWASTANVCLRTRQGTAFPGNEDRYYELNPGEAFAEVYRVLNELRAGATSFSWSLVDDSFYPNQAALDAAEKDVVAPWSAPSTSTVSARFNGKRNWTTTVSTPLDGSLDVSLRFPRGGLHELVVLAADKRTVLGTGLWSGGAEKRVTTTVCGQRTIVVRVSPRGSGRKFSVRVKHD
jgi:hypothetical protein